eukprot:scaffold96404_cov118-Phaeocystis_antarctica.AAC.4
MLNIGMPGQGARIVYLTRQGKREGRNASLRLGGDGPRRRRSGLQATRRVCSRRGTWRHLGWRR